MQWLAEYVPYKGFGISLEKHAFGQYCRSGMEIEVMRQLQASFDSTGILNAGNLL